MRHWLVGNWKMFGLKADLAHISALKLSAAQFKNVKMGIAPPSTLLAEAASLAGQGAIDIGGQDCAISGFAARTGDICAAQLKDAGAGFVILGHSERRTHHLETSETVAQKVLAAQSSGLKTIICVGEPPDIYAQGKAAEYIQHQLAISLPDNIDLGLVTMAYEPIWAVGTGLRADAAAIHAMHSMISSLLVERFGAEASAISILYGGSVTGENAAELFEIANVGGALVGGASLKVETFLKIAEKSG